MMKNNKSIAHGDFIFHILIWGSLWGIFEATAGLVLHLLPFRVGWLVWYPVACFFMANVYRTTGKVSSVLYIGMLSAAIKMLNLIYPISVDRVLNPAVSILFEAISLSIALLILKPARTRRRNPLIVAGAVLGMNTAWRLLYILYLLFVVPQWMREVSVIADTEQLVLFLLLHNIVTSIVLTVGYLLAPYMSKPVGWIENKLTVPVMMHSAVKIGLAVVLIGTNIVLELFL